MFGRNIIDVQGSVDLVIGYGVDPTQHWFTACNGEVGRWLSSWEVNPLDQSLSDDQYINARARALEEKYGLPDSLISGLSDRWSPAMSDMPLSFGTVDARRMELIANRVKAIDSRTLADRLPDSDHLIGRLA